MAFFSAREATNFDAKTAFAAAFLKVAALASTIVTMVLAAAILSCQVATWIFAGEWNAFPISIVLALAGLDELPATQAATGIQRIFDWGLDLPAGGFLLAVAAILVGSHLAPVRKDGAPTRKGSDREHITALIKSKGYHLPAGTMDVRLVHLRINDHRIQIRDCQHLRATIKSARPRNRLPHRNWPSQHRAVKGRTDFRLSEPLFSYRQIFLGSLQRISRQVECRLPAVIGGREDCNSLSRRYRETIDIGADR